jgi:hypothetical protein
MKGGLKGGEGRHYLLAQGGLVKMKGGLKGGGRIVLYEQSQTD